MLCTQQGRSLAYYCSTAGLRAGSPIPGEERWGGQVSGLHCLPPGFISNNEKKWRELRRFTLSTLRDFGMGKSSMSQRVQQEAQHLVELLAELKGDVSPIRPGSCGRWRTYNSLTGHVWSQSCLQWLAWTTLEGRGVRPHPTQRELQGCDTVMA